MTKLSSIRVWRRGQAITETKPATPIADHWRSELERLAAALDRLSPTANPEQFYDAKSWILGGLRRLARSR
jgi:hypothetical protein